MKQLTFLEACLVANFLKKNYPPVGNWDDPVGWAAWFLGKGFCAAIHGENGEILAVAAARPVEKPEDGVVPYWFKEGGTCMFIDLVVVPRWMPEGLEIFRDVAEKRFGRPKSVAYFRREEGQLRVRDYTAFMRKFKKQKERKDHGFSTTTNSA